MTSSESASIQNGTLLDWATLGSLAPGVLGAALVHNGPSVVLVGGQGGLATSSLRTGTFSGTPTVLTFNSAGVSLPVPVLGADVAEVAGRWFVVGGFDEQDPHAGVYSIDGN